MSCRKNNLDQTVPNESDLKKKQRELESSPEFLEEMRRRRELLGRFTVRHSTACLEADQKASLFTTNGSGQAVKTTT
jgi:hypothetical protein